KEVVAPFERSLEEAGLTLVSVQADPVVQTAIFPLVDGKAVPPEEFDQRHARGEITDAVHKAARESFTRIEHRLTEVNDRAGEIRRQHEEAVAELLGTAVRSILGARVRDILRTFPRPAVETFVTGIVNDVVTNWLGSIGQETDFTSLYRVNVVLEHHGEGACPVIAEDAPTVRNLIGTIDYDFESGDEPRTSHMGIRAGSLLRADGGFLLLEARDVLNEEAAWKVLMRVLRTGRLEIAPPETVLRGAVPSLKPEPIEINMTVVMIGDPDTYFALDAQDPDFPQLFKVLADFDTTMPRDDTGAAQYAGVLARIAREEGLGPFDRGAVAALVEHGARIASRNGKLTARFGRIADVAREGAFIARRRRARAVGAADVDEAVRRAKRRANLPSRRFRELVADGTIRVETVGSVVGQINGLAVLQAGPMVYGFPTRITATIGPGTAGVINIDREAALSGAIHTKGFYILGGLLRYLLRTDHPLAFDASVAFEQSYGAIDGDSASGAEICCLLSALTDVPLRQDIAVTGAIDQLGHILAVGAVNEKVEGFFDACRDVGLTGTQGVMIPKANAGDLMLRKDLVDACREGMFSVYAVETVHEVLSCLTGRPAGHRSHNGAYPKGTLLARAVARA
ncbi:MAG: Lon protease family protein, partial [Phycisphaerae bacterium]